MFKHVDSLFTGLNKSSGDFIGIIDFVDKELSAGWTNNRSVLELHIVLHALHCEVAAQDLKVVQLVA